MATGKALDGKPYAGNPHVRFDEGEVAPAATPRRGSLLYNRHHDSSCARGGETTRRQFVGGMAATVALGWRGASAAPPLLGASTGNTMGTPWQQVCKEK